MGLDGKSRVGSIIYVFTKSTLVISNILGILLWGLIVVLTARRRWINSNLLIAFLVKYAGAETDSCQDQRLALGSPLHHTGSLNKQDLFLYKWGDQLQIILYVYYLMTSTPRYGGVPDFILFKVCWCHQKFAWSLCDFV